MTSTREQRKAALAISILSPHWRRRVLESLPGQQQSAIRHLLGQISAQGWNNPTAVELALGVETAEASAVSIDSQHLLRLSRQLDSECYARVLIAADISDRGFLLSLLERDYAERVQKALREMPVLPLRLKQSLLAAARAYRAEAGSPPCAA